MSALRRSAKCDCGCQQAPPETCRTRKVECVDCGYPGRVSRSWLERGAPVCPCGGTMHATCLNDRALYDIEGTRAEWEERGCPGYGSPRARKGSGPLAGEQPTCKGCRRFIAHPHARCKACGQNNSQDGWTTRIPGKRAPAVDIPF